MPTSKERIIPLSELMQFNLPVRVEKERRGHLPKNFLEDGVKLHRYFSNKYNKEYNDRKLAGEPLKDLEVIQLKCEFHTVRLIEYEIALKQLNC